MLSSSSTIRAVRRDAAGRRKRGREGLELAARELPQEGDRERGSLARGALDRHGAPEKQGELAHDGEAEAGSAAGLVVRPFALAELLEDRVVLLRRDADARVRHDERPLVAAALLGAHLHSAGLGELQRVPDEIREDLIQLVRVADDGLEPGRGAGRQLEAFAPGGLLEVRLHLAQQRRDRDDLALDLGLSRFDLGDVENVVDQAEEEAGVALDALEAFLLLGIQLSLRAPQERAGEAQDDRHRRAQLVRDGRQESVLEGGGALELLRGPRDAAALLLEELVLLGEPARLLRHALVGGRVGDRHGQARRDRGQGVAGALREGLDGAEGQNADGLAEVQEGKMQALSRQDPAVEEVDRRRLRIDGDEDRPAFPGGAPGFFAGPVLVDPRRASDGGGGDEVAAAVRQVEKRARGAGHLQDLVEQRRADALEIVDRGGRGEHRVHRRFDVSRLEGPGPLVVEPGRFVEVVAERPHLVARGLEEPRGPCGPGRDRPERPRRPRRV